MTGLGWLGIIFIIIGVAFFTFGLGVIIDHNVSGNGKEHVSFINYIFLVVGLLFFIAGLFVVIKKGTSSPCKAGKGEKCIAVLKEDANRIEKMLYQERKQRLGIFLNTGNQNQISNDGVPERNPFK
jgi:hypothetical protein